MVAERTGAQYRPRVAKLKHRIRETFTLNTSTGEACLNFDRISRRLTEVRTLYIFVKVLALRCARNGHDK